MFSVLFYNEEDRIDVVIRPKVSREVALQVVKSCYEPHYTQVSLHEWHYLEDGKVTARVKIEPCKKH